MDQLNLSQRVHLGRGDSWLRVFCFVLFCFVSGQNFKGKWKHELKEQMISLRPIQTESGKPPWTSGRSWSLGRLVWAKDKRPSEKSQVPVHTHQLGKLRPVSFCLNEPIFSSVNCDAGNPNLWICVKSEWLQVTFVKILINYCGQRMSHAKSVNKGCCSHQVINHCSCPDRAFWGESGWKKNKQKTKILALDS